MNNNYDVFFSFSRADLEFVKRLEGELRANGITCWVDSNDIFIGESIQRSTNSAIANAKIFLCVISPNTRDNSSMIDEASFACKLGEKFVLPVYLEGADAPNRLNDLLAPYNSIYIGKDLNLSKLVDLVQNMLGKNIWVFVSHSNIDFAKIIKLRNKLEDRQYRPLLFFLKCLEDDQEIFELIKREIKARDRFLLCDSMNSKKSEWVQKEIEYIMSLNRPYEVIDIDTDESQIDEAIDRFDRRSTVYLWSTETTFNQKVAHELMKKSFRVSLLPLDFYQNYTSKLHKKDGYVLMLISRKLTEQETDAISIYAKAACSYTYPVVISEDAFANWELYKELQNLDGIKTSIYLLNSDKANEVILSFDSDEDRAHALVNHFVLLDNKVNNR